MRMAYSYYALLLVFIVYAFLKQFIIQFRPVFYIPGGAAAGSSARSRASRASRMPTGTAAATSRPRVAVCFTGFVRNSTGLARNIDRIFGDATYHAFVVAPLEHFELDASQHGQNRRTCNALARLRVARDR